MKVLTQVIVFYSLRLNYISLTCTYIFYITDSGFTVMAAANSGIASTNTPENYMICDNFVNIDDQYMNTNAYRPATLTTTNITIPTCMPSTSKSQYKYYTDLTSSNNPQLPFVEPQYRQEGSVQSEEQTMSSLLQVFILFIYFILISRDEKL